MTTISPNPQAPDCAACGVNTDALRQMGGGDPVHIGTRAGGAGRRIATVCGSCATDIAGQITARQEVTP